MRKPEEEKRSRRRAATGREIAVALSDIALGRREYTDYTSKGEEFACLPTVGERLKALELLGRLSVQPAAEREPPFAVELRVVEPGGRRVDSDGGCVLHGSRQGQ